MQAKQLVDVICDTSFLMVLANKPLKGLEDLESRYGKLEFIIPDIVRRELEEIISSSGVKRAKEARMALRLVDNFKSISLPAKVADEAIVDYASKHRCVVATIDGVLKNRLQGKNVPVITLSHDRVLVV